MSSDEATAETLADLLAQGRLIHRLSAPLTIAATIALPLVAFASRLHKAPGMVLLTVAVVLGLVEVVLALRVDFDARALKRIALRPDGMIRFDGALATLGLMPQDRAGRPMAERARGCLRLLRLQAIVAMAQVAVIVAAGWVWL
jgi:hypothetical protein